MKQIFLIQTANGNYPPKFEHDTIDSAVAEAKRLHEKYKVNIRILEVVGEIKYVEVPVTRTETKITITDRLTSDDLPF